MRKINHIGFLLGAMVLGMVGESAAAFTLKKQQVLVGRARITGNAKIEMSATIKPVTNYNNPAVFPEINWSLVDLNEGVTKWKIANHLIVLRTTFTTFNAGVQIATDNTDEDVASPRFFDPTPLPAINPPFPGTPEYISYVNNPDSNPAGLVLNYPGQTKFTLPVAWTVKASTKEVNSNASNGLLPTDPNSGDTTGNGYRFQWLFLTDKRTPAIDWNLNLQLGDTEASLDIDNNGDGDKSDLIDTPAFSSGSDNVTVLDAGRGLHVSQGNGFNGAGAGSRISFIYLQANFENAFSPFNTEVPPLEYTTNRLLIEAFTE